jgi:two-component system, NtrC family, response regulator HydG
METKILIVDDDNSHRQMLAAVLSADGYDVKQADSGLAAVAAVEAQFYDLILMDIRMEGLDGIAAQKQIKAISPGIPVIMMTGYASVKTAVEALKEGAFDYLTKPIDIDELKILVRQTLKHHQLEQENQLLKDRLGDRFDFGGIIGHGEAMQHIFETLELVAPTEASVLITGESGTGKELIANAIHHNSPRREQPFIKINCAALPETLLESELFGHEKGAFTGAASRKQGRFQLADKGSILLDEIGEMSPATQAKILRVLQEQEFESLGGTHTIKVDTRVIAATNKKLEEEIAVGRFREDLYYRLNVIPIRIPSLRERREDIPILADHFLKQYAQKNHRLIKGLSPLALDVLMRYNWSGNVRELENVMERAVILARGDIITPTEFPEALNAHESLDIPFETDIYVGKPLKEVEKDLILKTLEQAGGNRTHASKILGISRRTLQLKLKEYGVN